MKGPLCGIRVLDISRAIAGPYEAMLLGDMGAEVIKVEVPEGDISRFSAGPTHKGENFLYMAFNRNKKNVVLDLDTDSGKQAFYDLVKVADVVVNNLRPGATERLKIDYSTLKKINSRIICSSITGYGRSGPSKDNPAFDVVVLAASGILSLSREKNGPPVRPAAPIGDMAAGIFAAFGVLGAIIQRERTGKGQRVEVSLLDTCISLLSYQLSEYFCSGIVPQPLSNSGHTVSVPYGVYKTKAGYLAIGSCWPRIARAIGAEWMIDDPRFSEMEARRKNRDELNAIIERQLLDATAEDWLNIFRAEDIPAEKVKTLDEVITDPQVIHQKMIINLKHSLGGEIKLAASPIKMSSVSEKDYTAPPTQNQHEHEVLGKLLGYPKEKIKVLRAEQKLHTDERKKHVRKVQ